MVSKQEAVSLVNCIYLWALTMFKVEGSTTDLSSLQQVQIIFRHGLRSPNKPYPGDPYSDEAFWPQGWGMLTNEGKRQQYELGKFIRGRYKNFINDSYSPREFEAISSESPRAVMSLQANLAGIFPPKNPKDQWSEDFPTWQPIPFKTIPPDIDAMIQGTASCPRFNDLWTDLLEDEDQFLRTNREFQRLYEYIGQHTGKKYRYPIDLTSFYEALIIQTEHNLTLPEWTKEIFPGPESQKLLSFAFGLVVKTEEMKKLRGGPLLHHLITNMKAKIKEHQENGGGVRGKKMILFSGHDITLARIMDTISVFNPPHLPDFNAALILELHRSVDGQYFLEVFYKNGLRTNEIKLEVGGCDSPCYFPQFLTLTQDRVITPDDWRNSCSHSRSNEDGSTGSFWEILCYYGMAVYGPI